MKVCTCFLLFGIFAYTNSKIQIKPKNHHRGVSPALANVSKLSNEEYSGDTKILDKTHNVITNETKGLDKNKNLKPVFKTARVETITDFIQELVNILNTYENTAYEDFFRILDTEIRRYHYKDCKFSALMQNHDTRSWLARTLNITRVQKVYFIKAKINAMVDMIRHKLYGKDVTKLLDYINSLYRHTEEKCHRVLKELKHYRRSKSRKDHNNLVKAIRRGVRVVLFDHYTELDSNTKRELKERIETFWKRFKNNHASNAEVIYNRDINAVSDSLIDRMKLSVKVIDKIQELEPYSINGPQNNFNNKNDRRFSLVVSETGSDTQSVLTVKPKPVLRAKHHNDKQQYHGKPEKTKPKSKDEIVHVMGEYNAVIDVQLANTDLLKSLGIFKPVPDKKRGNTSYQRIVTKTTQDMFGLDTKSTRKPSALRTGPKKPTALRKPPLRHSTAHESIYEYLNPLSNLRNNIAALFSKEESNVFIQLMNDNNVSKNLKQNENIKKDKHLKRNKDLKHDKDFEPDQYLEQDEKLQLVKNIEPDCYA